MDGEGLALGRWGHEQGRAGEGGREEGQDGLEEADGEGLALDDGAGPAGALHNT